MSTQEILDCLMYRYRDLLDRKIVSNRTTLYRWMAPKRPDGTTKPDPFPSPIRLGENTVAWRAADVEAWIERRAKATEAQRITTQQIAAQVTATVHCD